jgi:hypothetical protein
MIGAVFRAHYLSVRDKTVCYFELSSSCLMSHSGSVVALATGKDELYEAHIDTSQVDERRLLRKIDIRVVPWLGLLYFLNFLDRGSIGNAKVMCSGYQLNFKILTVFSYTTWRPIWASQTSNTSLHLLLSSFHMHCLR